MSESSSLGEVPEDGRSPSPSRHWVILGALVLGHALLGVVLNPGRISSSPNGVLFSGLVAGFFYSQPLLLAFWTAFARQRFSHRILWGLPLCVGVAVAAEVGGLLVGNSMPWWNQLSVPRGFFLSMDLILFSVMTPLLMLVRRLSRWALAQAGTEVVSSSYRAHQYGIKHLVILTIIAAVVCSLFRSLTVIDPSASIQPVAEVVIAVLVIATLLLPVAFIPLFTLGGRWQRLAAVVVIAVVLLPSDLACFFLIPNARTVPGAQTQVLREAIVMQLGAGLSVFISTLVMRRCGFRMVRVERGAVVPLQ